jgi:hypothetical protein
LCWLWNCGFIPIMGKRYACYPKHLGKFWCLVSLLFTG